MPEVHEKIDPCLSIVINSSCACKVYFHHGVSFETKKILECREIIHDLLVYEDYYELGFLLMLNEDYYELRFL